jgi:hypothetical protein
MENNAQAGARRNGGRRESLPEINRQKLFRMNPLKALLTAQLKQNPEYTLLSFDTNAERLKLFKQHERVTDTLRARCPSCLFNSFQIIIVGKGDPFPLI